MKPADHPEFFTRPPPPGRSRESTLRLDREGRFWHDGKPVEHEGMARSFASWMDRHPGNGRFVLNNGYDWTYIEVEDAAFQVRTLHPEPATRAPDGAPRGEIPWLELSDGSQEPLDGATLWLGPDDAVYCLVRQGRLPARFTPSAQLALEPYLVPSETEGEVAVRIGGRDHVVPSRPPGTARTAQGIARRRSVAEIP